jgi:hypothetical protein
MRNEKRWELADEEQRHRFPGGDEPISEAADEDDEFDDEDEEDEEDDEDEEDLPS